MDRINTGLVSNHSIGTGQEPESNRYSSRYVYYNGTQPNLYQVTMYYNGTQCYKNVTNCNNVLQRYTDLLHFCYKCTTMIHFVTKLLHFYKCTTMVHTSNRNQVTKCIKRVHLVDVLLWYIVNRFQSGTMLCCSTPC